jgi:hypothetical protein
MAHGESSAKPKGIETMTHDTDSMVRAHRAGCDYAHRIGHNAREAQIIANGLSNADEQIAFIAGYQRTKRRMAPTMLPVPLRPIYAPGDSAAYCAPIVLSAAHAVHYGESDWPSACYMLVNAQALTD